MTKHMGQDRDDVASKRSEIRGSKLISIPNHPTSSMGWLGGAVVDGIELVSIVPDPNEPNGVVGAATFAGIMRSFFCTWIYISKQYY